MVAGQGSSQASQIAVSNDSMHRSCVANPPKCSTYRTPPLWTTSSRKILDNFAKQTDTFTENSLPDTDSSANGKLDGLNGMQRRIG